MPWTRTSHTGMCLRIPGRPWQTAGSALVDLERRRCCWSSDHTYSSESLPHHGSHVGQRGEGPAACLLSQETYPREEASRERGMLKHPALLSYPFYFRSSRLASKSDGVCLHEGGSLSPTLLIPPAHLSLLCFHFCITFPEIWVPPFTT